MKRVLLLVVLAVLLVQPVVLAADNNPTPQDPNALVGKVDEIVGLAGRVFGIIMVGVLILLGIKFAISAGNPHARAECVQWAVFAFFGMVLGFGARWWVGVAMGIIK